MYPAAISVAVEKLPTLDDRRGSQAISGYSVRLARGLLKLVPFEKPGTNVIKEARRQRTVHNRRRP
jgi:hypothetical protein